MLENILKDKNCFKLVCGAGNKDAVETEKLVALYAKAGANFFDISAEKEILDAAKRGLGRVIPENETRNYYFCISVGIKGDPHTGKAIINPDKCISCGKCFESCLNKAVITDSEYLIDRIRCIGCGRCQKECPVGAIDFYFENQPLEEILPPLTKTGIDCIELHANGSDDEEVYEQWGRIESLYDGILSICIDRSNIGNKPMIKRIQHLIKNRKPFSTIVQADGSPMSGFDDKYKTTLQAIATAEIFQDENLPVFILLSGGTNAKTVELAKLCEIDAHGIAAGSYARKIVREYIDRDDFWDNPDVFNKALSAAKQLVNKSVSGLRKI